MASSSASERNVWDKKGGLETKTEEQGLNIETETMETQRQSQGAARLTGKVGGGGGGDDTQWRGKHFSND